MIEVKETFCTTMVLEDIIVPNTWYVSISLVPNTGKNKLYTKAMDRIQYYIADVLDNSVFIGAHNLAKIANLPFKAQVHEGSEGSRFADRSSSGSESQFPPRVTLG